MKISLIIPVYNEDNNIKRLYDEICIAIKELRCIFELIFIDDGSEDNSLKILSELAEQDSRIKVISFTKNFGHQNALLAGYRNCSGDAAITMDSDMQHPPSLIPDFIEKWQEGYFIVNALRTETEGAGFFKKFISKSFYKVLSYLSDVQLPKGSSDFRLIDRKIVDIIKCIEDNNLFFRGIINWTGFKSFSIYYIANHRYSGKTKYTINKMFEFSLNGITSFSTVPLRLTLYFGIIITFLSFVYIFYALYENIIKGITIEGWTSVLISILFIGGIQLVFLGIIGEYVGRIFSILKKRPLFLIKKTINL
jgi:dolichol-phosphate mannosyltransferase